MLWLLYSMVKRTTFGSDSHSNLDDDIGNNHCLHDVQPRYVVLTCQLGLRNTGG